MHLTVGFADGLIRRLKRCEDEFELVSVFKPHPVPVRLLAYGPAGDFASAADDATIFFFDSNYEPMGFCKMPAIPTSLVWASNDSVLVTLQNGMILEVEKPKAQSVRAFSFCKTHRQI